jgi:hypothetical protein
MALTATNIQQNWRATYCEFVGDGSTTTITIPDGIHYGGQSHTGNAFVVTVPTSFSHRSGGVGFLFPEGTPIPVSSATVVNGSVTINMSSAVANGTKTYASFVYDKYTTRG